MSTYRSLFAIQSRAMLAGLLLCGNRIIFSFSLALFSPWFLGHLAAPRSSFKSGSFRHSAAAPQDLLLPPRISFSPLKALQAPEPYPPPPLPSPFLRLICKHKLGRAGPWSQVPAGTHGPFPAGPPRHAHTTARPRPHVSSSRVSRGTDGGVLPRNHAGAAVPPQQQAGHAGTPRARLMLRLGTGRHTECRRTHRLTGRTEGREKKAVNAPAGNRDTRGVG